jgi:hypothetical protein
VPEKYVAGAMAPPGAALDRPAVERRSRNILRVKFSIENAE